MENTDSFNWGKKCGMTFLKKNTNAKEHLYHSATLAFIDACQKEMKTSPKQAYSES